MLASVVLFGEGCFSKAGAKDVLFLRRLAAVATYNPFESSRIRQLWFLRCVFVAFCVLEDGRQGKRTVDRQRAMRVENNSPRPTPLSSLDDNDCFHRSVRTPVQSHSRLVVGCYCTLFIQWMEGSYNSYECIGRLSQKSR